jgi:hypothetical protein
MDDSEYKRSAVAAFKAVYCTPSRDGKTQALIEKAAADAYAAGFRDALVVAARHIDDADEDLPKHKLAAEVRALKPSPPERQGEER